jgi:hypothetical protein
LVRKIFRLNAHRGHPVTLHFAASVLYHATQSRHFSSTADR